MPQQLRSTTRISAEPEGPITVKEHTRHKQRLLRAVVGLMRRFAVRGRVVRVIGGRLRLRVSVAARSRSLCSSYSVCGRRIPVIGRASRAVIAGSNWNNATNCSSQARNANNQQSNTNSNISCHAVTDLGLVAKLTPSWTR